MQFTRRDLLKIILPLFIEQLLAVTVGMADSMMVATAGEAAVSGVSLVDTINILMINIFAALATGGAVVCSQFIGKKDYDSARSSAKQLLYATLAVSTVIMVIALLFRTSLLKLIFGGVSAEVMENAKIYFLITVLSYPFLALYNGGAALFRSMGNSKISMKVSVMMNLINVAGNALLIFGFGLGVAGAAIATLLSRIVGSVIMLVLLHDRTNPIYVEELFHYVPNFSIIKNILHIGIPSGIENGMFQFGKLLTQSLISTFGTAAIAANAVAGTLSTFEYAIGSAIGLSLITVVGQCIGAGDRQSAKHYTVKLLKIEYISIGVMVVLMSVLLKPILALYNLSDAATSQTVWLMLLQHVFAVTVWPLSFTLPNSFRAASDVRYPMVVSVVSMWAFRVGFSYVYALGMDMGVFGVWLAMVTDWVFRAVLFTIRYARGKWLTKYKEIQTAKSA